MAEYRLKPGMLGQKVMNAYQKTEQVFKEKFLEEDSNSPTGYSLKTSKIESGVVGTYKKVESAFVDAFLEETDGTPAHKTDEFNA